MRNTAIGLLALVCATGSAVAQSCTTQSRLSSAVRDGLSEAALSLANDVKAGAVDKLKVAAIAEYAANFEAAGALIRATSAQLAGDTLQVTQLYILDAHNRKSTDTTDADFSCPLQGTASETDFSISGLPPGLYAFVMVEAKGERPWLVSLLMRQEAGTWKLAGLYPHARLAAGHDGLWYWNSARDDVRAKQPWFAWLLYGEADALLRPANFASSTNLDKLRSERQSVAPAELADGVSAQTPLVLRGANGAQFNLIGLSSEGSDDGKRLNVVLHVQASADAAPPDMAFNAAVASAFFTAHKELRQGFDGVTVIAESSGRAPFVTEQKTSEVQ